jgi:hypothetical protein
MSTGTFFDRVIAFLAAPFDFLQQKLGRRSDDEGPYDPTLWL